MPMIYTIEGSPRRRRKGGGSMRAGTCKMVKARGRGCKIELCRGSSGPPKFVKGSKRCS